MHSQGGDIFPPIQFTLYTLSYWIKILYKVQCLKIEQCIATIKGRND